MYKIPGYCPANDRVFPIGEGRQLCKGGEWFWFLYRDNFLAFDFDSALGASAPAWGKGEQFCVKCHAGAADTDWLWITEDLVKRQQELKMSVSRDGSRALRRRDEPEPTAPRRRPLRSRLARQRGTRQPDVQLLWLGYPCGALLAGQERPTRGSRYGQIDHRRRPRVWETYKQAYEIFQPGRRGWSLKDQQWNDPQPLPDICRAALDNAGKPAAGVLAFQVLNETHQTFGSQFDTLIDQNGNQAQYNVRVNRDEFEFIKQGGFANTGNYDYGGPLATNKRLVRLPDDTNGFTGEGATEVKSAWKILCTDPKTCNPVDDPSRYFTHFALIYTAADQRVASPFQNAPLPRPTVTTPAACKTAQVGLVGFHIAAKNVLGAAVDLGHL